MESALRRAADLLGRARLPVFGGLLTDIAGAAAALALAEKLGGVIDHAYGESLSRMAQIMRERGASSASFGEVRNRADVVIVAGTGPLERDPGLIDKLFPEGEGLPRPGDNKRALIVLGGAPFRAPRHIQMTVIEHDLPALMARLGAAVGGRPTGDDALGRDLARVAARLRAAAFAVFVYSAEDLDEPALFTILDTVRDLSATTRAATLALATPGNGDGVNLCSTWTCGLPVRTSFAGPVPEHDTRRFDARRLIESGEADALVWIDALEGEGAVPPKGVPTIVLSSKPARAAKHDVVIDVACAGRDHDAALYLQPISGIGMVKAVKPDDARLRVAAVLSRLAEMIPQREAA
ncbi:MAG: hypothetical protein ACRECX_01080 [Methyloceanibacter sp.]|uniref:hypothetical protein n=1 Tax=Methyloceanibacter sp. TaxID=1965321 RepID=UPI003D6C8B44